MKRLVLLAALLAGCRPADGGARAAPGGTSAASPAAANAPQAPADSAANDSLLQRADAGRIQGAGTAPVWLVEISDFQCPYCKMWHDDIYPVIKRDYVDRGIVRMAYVHLPLSIHPNAPLAAEASLCAAVQEKFWPMHDQLFTTQERWAPLPDPASFFDSLAVVAGVKRSDYQQCMGSRLMQRVINGDRSRAAAAGVRSTPVFFVGDEPIQGLAPIDTYRQAIERARAKATSRPGE